ncbi:MAG: MBL fold metallo-hydrolase [Syntrophomonadaceae bacterium]|nr:MBL fold metallo-hydrolase [Syntrophomonadaceae bacterium]
MKKLINNIYLLELPQFNYPFCNCLWIEDEINCLMDSSPIDEELARLNGKKLDLIVNSHGHIDHNRSNYLFPEAKVLLHESNFPLVESREGYLKAFGFDRLLDESWQNYYLDAPGYQPRPADGTLEDGQIISLGSTVFQVLHLPGHIYGHCGFFFPDDGLVFTADIDLNLFGPWYGNMTSDVDDFINSIERLIQMDPAILVTGHGQKVYTSGIKPRLAAYRDTMYSREEEIIKLLHRGKRTVSEIGAEKPIYRRFLEPDRIFYLYECVMDWKHLQRLERLGRVSCHNGKYHLNEGIRPSNLNLG